MMNKTEFMDVSEFDPVRSTNEMNICSTVDTSINTTDRPNGFPKSNHKNMTTQRHRVVRKETEWSNSENPVMIKKMGLT